jgi:predicted dehydrogenase
MGTNHARVYAMLRGADLVGVADPDRSARERVAATYGVASFASHEQLLGSVDAVSIAVPTREHVPIALACLAAGAHVLVEKPIAPDIASAERLVGAAQEAGRVLQVGHVERFNPAVTQAADAIAAERLLAIAARRLSPPTPHVPEDVVLDLLIHDIDIAMHLAASEVRTVHAMGRADGRGELQLVMAQLAFRNGVLAGLTASKVTQERVRELDLTTDRSHVAVNYRTRDVLVYRKGQVSVLDQADRSRYRQEAVIERPSVVSAEPLYLELEHFLACVRGAAPRVRPAEAVASLAVALRVRELAAASARASSDL